jgi:hypothetical protein
MPELVVFATASASVLSWAAAEALRSRMLWSLGAMLMMVHALAAFGVFYGWSHHVARELTMRQTLALTGIVFAGGIYVNYAFIAVWIGDAGWWWISPRSYEERPLWLTRCVRGFIFFIMLNGAVVFADGWARSIGSISVALVLVAWLLKLSWRRGASSTAG